jgi:hypothetical protein
MKAEIKTYRFVTFTREHGSDIVFVEYAKNLNVDFEIAKELVANKLDFTLDKSHYCIIDFSNIKYFNPAAKLLMQSPKEGGKNILAAAFFTSNMVATLLANIFIRKIKEVPVKFFTNKKDAILWIDELKQKHINRN